MDKLRPGAKASKASATAGSPATTGSNEVDPRQYAGPAYCPELRVYGGAALLRTYEHGHQGDQNFVQWQASIGNTARECLYDQMGALTIKVGVSGRAVTGPKGAGGPVMVPIKIAVVRFQEAVLATERYTESVTIPPQGSTVFSQVRNISVASPGDKHNYLIYIGFDEGDWDPMKPSNAPVAAIDQPAPAPAPAPAPPPPEAASAAPPAPAKPKTTPNELPVPNEGFVLTQ